MEKSSLAHLCAYCGQIPDYICGQIPFSRRRTSDGIQDPSEPESGEERPLKGKGQGRVVLRFRLLSLNVAHVLGVRRCRASLEYFQTLLVIIISRGATGIDSAGVVLFVIKMS